MYFLKNKFLICLSGRGINIHNVKLENNKSLLMCAVSKKMCTLLFQVYGANIEHENDNGVTAVMVFASRGYFECAQYILDHGANVNHMSTSRKNALWNAVNRGYPNMIDLIINKGGDVNYPYPTYKNKWEPLLYIAAKNKRYNIMKLLISHDINVNAHNVTSGNTNLHLVARDGMVDAANFLLDNKADKQITNYQGLRPKNLAIDKNQPYEHLK